jgi:phage terminase large subunit-like protein
MPPRKKPKQQERLNLDDLTSSLSNLVLKQADEPNLLGYKPHTKQELFHRSTAKGRWFLGGNRSGKSVAGIVEDIWWCTKRHPYKRIPSHTQIRGRVVASDFTNGVETILFPIVKRWVLPSDLINGSWEDSYVKDEKTLYFRDGSFIEFRSCDQDLVKHAGTSRHFIHFDEEPPKLYFEENLARIIDTNGFWWMTMTPVEGMTWVHSDLYAPDNVIPSDMLFIIEVEMSDNTFLTVEGQNNVLAYFSEETREARQRGKFAVKGGKVLTHYRPDIHHRVSPGWRPPSDWLVYTTQDHGYRNPAGVAWNAVHPSGKKIVTFHEIYERGVRVDEIARMMREFEEQNHLKDRIFMRTGDPAMKQTSGITGTSVLFEYAMNDIIIGVEGIPKDESIGIDRMNTYLAIDPMTKRPFWEITQECPKHNWEFKKLAWKTYASPRLNDRQNPLEKVHDKDNHLFDAQKYFFTFMRDLGYIPEVAPAVNEPGSLLSVFEEMQRPYEGPNPVSKWDIVETVPVHIDEATNEFGWSYGD